MQSRRKDHITGFSSAKLRKEPRIEMDHDRYSISRRIDARDKSPSLRRSPYKLDRSGRGLLVDRRNASPDRREYGLHLGRGRGIRNMSRSPPYEQMRKRSYFDEGPVDRKYEYMEPMDFNDGTHSTSRHVYGHDHGLSRIDKEKDYSETKVAGIEEHEMFDGNSIRMESGMIRGLHSMPPDLGPTPNYRETARHVPSLSKSMDIARIEHGELSYQETMQLGKVAIRESYREEDKHMCSSRDVPYTTVESSHSKDLASIYQYSDTVGSSSGLSRSEVLISYGDGTPMSASKGYPRNIGKLAEPTGFNTYVPGPRRDPVRNFEGATRSTSFYQHGACSPSRAEHEEYFYGEPQEIVKDELLYPSGGSQRFSSSHNQVDYNRTTVNYDYRNLSRSSVMHPAVERFHNNEDSGGNVRMNSVSDHPALQKEMVPDYLDFNRSYPLKQGGNYLGSGRSRVELERKVSQDSDISHLDPLQERHVSHLRSNLDFDSVAAQEFRKERLQSSPASRYDPELQGFGLRMHRMEREREIYEPSDRVLKRKYNMEESIGRHKSKTIMSSKLNIPEQYEDLYDSEEEWIDADIMSLYQPKNGRLNYNGYRKSGRIYNWQDHSGDCASDDWLSHQDSLPLTQGPSVRFYKQGGRYIKGHQRPGSLKWHNSHHTDKRSGLHKSNKVWKRNDNYNEDVHDNDAITSDLAESDAYEDSEEFKQLIHEAFLKYTKKLNVNAAVQRRYKEQGKAGSLFCIVCGRSASKEFMDTQRLVTHAFMSHRGGLRALHLGLHKAICVLLGWNCVVPHDTITWVPQVLSDAEALAEKEDLILWPPVVVIHNISMLKNIPKEQNVIPVEGIEAFLRGKGFVGGKVSLGRPSDQSIMVVKFLGTFTGLANAERLHKYFTERKHGRVDFNRITSKCKINLNVDTKKRGEKLEECLLYGYMGIAEDLDRVDFNTKKSSLVKSKKEIQDLANAPVKPDDR